MGLFGKRNGQMDISAPRMKKPKDVKQPVIRSKRLSGVQSWQWKVVHILFLLHGCVLVSMVAFPNFVDWLAVAGDGEADALGSEQDAYVLYTAPSYLSLLLGAAALSHQKKAPLTIAFLAVNFAALAARAAGLAMAAGDDYFDYGSNATALFATEVALAGVEEVLVVLAFVKLKRTKVRVGGRR